MRKEYDFSRGRRNPYAARLKKAVTIRLDEETIAYFKALSVESGLPYQTLINLYLRDCASSRRALRWAQAKSPRSARRAARAG
jgi:predicted DNA binding CopG/RHH family protein